MTFGDWIGSEWDEAVGRLNNQVFGIVPPEQRLERPGGGSSIQWITFHISRHAALALSVLQPGDDAIADLAGAAGFDVPPSGGLQEANQAWAEALDGDAVDRYWAAVSGAAGRYLSTLSLEATESEPPVDLEAPLTRAKVDPDEFGWLYKMWSGQPVGFFVRWPIVGHVINHGGEMIAIRNILGLSPF